MSVKAVVFDLDDTLFGENEYVISGFGAAAEVAEAEYGIHGAQDEFIALFDAAREDVFNRFAEAHGLDGDAVNRLVATYRDHTPNIALNDGVREVLCELRDKGYKLGIITDGRPQGQRKKINALGLNTLIDEIIITDELGGEEYRKPNPKAFEIMCERLGVNPEEMLYVGDNPKKDFAIKKYLPIKTARLYGGGMYASNEYADGIKENYGIKDMSELIDCVTQDEDAEAALLSFVKEKLLRIMDFIHDVCIKEDIKYSLSGGTLIGAVRHKGFIPWDDDIDIVMKREEYNKFESVIQKYCEDSKEFEFFLYRRTPRVKFVKDPVLGDKRIGGIKVDIFLIDNLPDKKSKRKRFLLKLKILQGMMHKGKINWSEFGFKRRVQLFVTKTLGAGRSEKSIVKSYFKNSARYNDKVTRDKFISNDLFVVCGIPYGRDWVEDVMPSKFEDREYLIFADYDNILKARYGDYMQLPPKEQQIHHHNFTVMPIDESEASK